MHAEGKKQGPIPRRFKVCDSVTCTARNVNGISNQGSSIKGKATMKTSFALVFIALAALIGSASAADPLSSASVSGTVKAATIQSAKSVDDVVGTVIKVGTTIDTGNIKSGILVKGKASGGDMPTSVSLDRSSDIVKIKNLTGVSISGAELTDAELDGVIINGSPVDLSGKKLHITNATLNLVDIDDAAIPRADLEKPKSSPATVEAKNIPLKGDYFLFKTDITKFRSSDNTNVEVTAPKGSCFRVSQEVEFPDSADSTKKKTYARGTFATGWFQNYLLPPYWCASATKLEARTIKPGETYEVPKEQIVTDRDRLRYGWTYGVLVAPFKYYPKEQVFSAGASVGPYLGYRFRDRPGESSVLAFSVGATSTTFTTKNSDGTSNSSTETGLSTALVWIIDIKDAFNVGFLAGSDFYTRSKDVPNNGKLWLGVSFGLRLD